FLMACRLLVVCCAQCPRALLVAHGAVLSRPRTLTRRLVARLDVGLLVMGGSVLIESMRSQLRDLCQAILNLRSVCGSVVSLGRPGAQLVDRGPMLGGACPRLLGVTPCTQRLLAARSGLLRSRQSLLAPRGLLPGDGPTTLGLFGGYRLRDVLQLCLLCANPEENLGDPPDRHHSGADEERQLDLAARAAADQVREQEGPADPPHRSSDRIEERDRQRPRLHREDLRHGQIRRAC